MEDSKCKSETKPDETTNCDNCAMRWEPREWKPCDVQCGQGHQIRNIVCFRGEYKVSPKNCLRHKKLQKPKTTKKCKAKTQCPKWRKTGWSECSTNCGVGVQTRSAKCKLRHTHAIVENSKCSKLKKPKLTRRCKSRTDCNKGNRFRIKQLLLSCKQPNKHFQTI